MAAVLGALVVLGVRATRRYEERIRDWARENGYAILDIKYQRLLPWDWDIPFMPSYFAGGHPFRVGIQDDQGGQTTVTIWFKRLNGPMEVRWVV